MNAIAEVDALLRDVDAHVSPLSDEQANWRPKPGVWSVTENVDHLTISTRRMIKAIDAAVESSGAPKSAEPFRPSLFAKLFLWILEPPVRLMKVKTTADYVPKPDRPKHVSLGEFMAAHQEFRHRLENEWKGVDVNKVEVVSPFDERVKYALGTAIALVPAHGRRHLWQMRQLRA